VDRGGLTCITTEVYQFFIAIETCTRRYLKVSKATKMSEGFQKFLTDCILHDENVLFYWCLAGQDESDQVCQKCMVQFVEKWITIRGFSFVNNMMEMYKQSEKKGTVKSKSLHSNFLHNFHNIKSIIKLNNYLINFINFTVMNVFFFSSKVCSYPWIPNHSVFACNHGSSQ